MYLLFSLYLASAQNPNVARLVCMAATVDCLKKHHSSCADGLSRARDTQFEYISIRCFDIMAAIRSSAHARYPIRHHGGVKKRESAAASLHRHTKSSEL